MFTFPAISRDMDFDSELADQLFSNGKFLLHVFPVQSASFTIPRSTILSRTSSISSKGSLMSSRSNSTNSRSSSSNSSCSSARTSTSEASSRRKLSSINQARSVAIKTKTNTSGRFPKKEGQNRQYCNSYGRSQRWQFIAPVPVLNRRNSSQKRKGGNGKQDGGARKGVCRRFLGWLVSTCQECHAIEPSKRLKVSM